MSDPLTIGSTPPAGTVRISSNLEPAESGLGARSGYTVGDVFQINEKHGRNGWIGAFVMATEIKPWGIQGFVSHIETHDQQNRAYIRLKWEELDYIGHAQLIPGDEAE